MTTKNNQYIDNTPTHLDIEILEKVSGKFDQYKSFSSIGTKSFFDWMTPYTRQESKETIVFYVPYGATEYDMVRMSRFTKFPRPVSPHFYAYTSLPYTRKLAQLYSGTKGNAFVLKFEVAKDNCREFDYYEVNGGGKLYLINIDQMGKMHADLLGKIELVDTVSGAGSLPAVSEHS
jgi:hypothetical protein